MSFIQREIDRLLVALSEESKADNETKNDFTELYKRLAAARQALVWVLDPGVYCSPSVTILGTQTQEFTAPVAPPMPEDENPLHAPSAHPLQDCLAELKFGRPAEAQSFLDRMIAELNGELQTPQAIN